MDNTKVFDRLRQFVFFNSLAKISTLLIDYYQHLELVGLPIELWHHVEEIEPRKLGSTSLSQTSTAK